MSPVAGGQAAREAASTAPACNPSQIDTGTSCNRKELKQETFKHYLFEFPMPSFDGNSTATEVMEGHAHGLDIGRSLPSPRRCTRKVPLPSAFIHRTSTATHSL